MKSLSREIQLAQQLKNLCDENGREPENKLEESAEILYQLGLIYREKSPDEVSLIQSAGLFNAALVRKKGAPHIQESLKEVCSHVLLLAGAKKENADLVQHSRQVKDFVENMRSKVRVKLNEIQKIKNEDSGDILFIKEQKKTSEMKELQEMITKDFTEIMHDLSKYCVKVLGIPPESYALAGLGSLARKEITPYSDFEHFILLKEGSQSRKDYENVLEYFRWFTVLYQIVVINLQETVVRRLAVPSLNDTTVEGGNWFCDVHTTCGISFDSMLPHGSKNPLGRKPTPKHPIPTELIKPVSGMLEYLSKKSHLKYGYNLSDVLMESCFVSGDPGIYEDFKKGVTTLRSINHYIIKADVVKQVEDNLFSFGVRSQLENNLTSKEKFEFKVKPLIYRVTTLFISALGKFHSISASSCFDIINQLVPMLEIREFAQRKLSYAVAVACEVRLRHCMKYENQDASLNASDLLEYVGERSVLNYFHIAYALQCEISKITGIKNVSFYPVPYLLNISACWLLQLNQKLSQILTFDNWFTDEKLEYTKLHECLILLEKEISDAEKYDVTQHPENSINDAKNDAGKIRLFAEKYAGFFYATGMYEFCISFLLYKQRFTEPEISNLDSFYDAAVAQQIIGLSYMNLKQFNEACEFLKRFLKTNQHFIENSPRFKSTEEEEYLRLAKKFVVSTLFNIGECLFELKDYDESINCFIRSRDFLEYLPLEQQIFCFENDLHLGKNFAQTLFGIGERLFWKKEYQQSMNYFLQLHQFYVFLPSEVDPGNDILSSLHAYIGHINIQNENDTDALNCFNRGVEALSTSSRKVMAYAKAVIEENGNLFCSKCEWESALKYFNRYLEIQKEDTASPRYMMLQTKLKISQCFRGKGEVKTALQYLKEIEHELEEILPDVNGDGLVVWVYDEFGCCYDALTEKQKALSYHKKSLLIKESVQTNYQSSAALLGLADSYGHVGVLLLGLNRTNEVLPYLDKARVLYEKCLNETVNSEPKTETNLEISKSVRRLTKKLKSVLISFNQLNLKTKISHNLFNIAVTYANLITQNSNIAVKSHNMGNSEKDLIFCKKALSMRRSLPLSKDAEEWYAGVHYCAAQSWYRLDYYDRALIYFEKSLKNLEVCKTLSDVNDEKHYSSLFLYIADCLLKLNRPNEAAKPLTTSWHYFCKASSPEVDLQKRLANVLCHLGVVTLDTDRMSNALKCFKRALSVRPLSAYKEDEAWFTEAWFAKACYDTASCWYYMKDYNRALVYFEKSLKHQRVYQHISGDKNRATCCRLFKFIADCLMKMDRPDDASIALTKSLQYFMQYQPRK